MKEWFDRKSLLLYGWTVFFFSLFASIGLLFEHSWSVFFSGWLVRAGIAALLIGLCAIIWKLICQYRPPERKEIRLSDRSLFWILFVFLIICSLPAFLAFFPGTIGADVPKQLAQYDHVLPLSTHHPLLHTYLVGWLIDLGTLLTGSSLGGAALYTIFQIALCNFAVAKSLQIARQMKASLWVIAAGALLYGLNPYAQILLCYSTKDIPYAAALLLFGAYGCKFLFDPASKKKLPALGGMLGWGIVMCLLRNQGIYMIVLVLAVGLIAWRKQLKERRITIWVVSQAVILGVSFLCTSIVPSIAGIEIGNAREMLSVPSQQIAQALNQSQNSNAPRLNAGQQAEAAEYFDGFDPQTFDRLSADPDKDLLRTDRILQDPVRFLKVWGKTVLSDFSQAVFAWTDLVAPYFDMRLSTYFTGLNTLYSYEEYLAPREIHAAPVLGSLREYYANLTTVPRQHQLGWKIALFDPSLCLYVMIYLLGYGLIRKKPLCLYTSGYGFVYFLSLLLGPVALSRYLFVLMIEVPFWLCALNISWRQKQFN